MNNNGRKALCEIQKIYDDVSKWTNYFEVKHAAMLAAEVALLVGIIKIQISFIAIQFIFIIFLGITMIINAISLMPFLNRKLKFVKWCRKDIKNASENLVFYQSIFALSIDQNSGVDTRDNYKRKFLAIFNINLQQCPKLINNYLDQVVEVSIVVSVEAWLFKIASTFLFVVLVITMILSFIVA